MFSKGRIYEKRREAIKRECMERQQARYINAFEDLTECLDCEEVEDLAGHEEVPANPPHSLQTTRASVQGLRSRHEMT
jgi:hypothetical protein